MLKTRTIRAKTENKEKRDGLPKVRQTYKMATSTFFERSSVFQFRKLSDTMARKETEKEYPKVQTILDENRILMIESGKAAIKYSKKRINNQFMLVKQIGMPGSFTATKPNEVNNLIDFVGDQYQGQREYNEDRILMTTKVKLMGKTYHIFAVFDGHGGSLASEFAKSNFVRFLEEQITMNPMLTLHENLRKCISRMQAKICEMSKTKHNYGGTCASILLIHNNQYDIAHVGDSRVIAITCNKDTGIKCQQITTDHKPDQPTQRERIQSVGGRVYRNRLTFLNENVETYGPFRVFPGKLSVSRSLGDYQAKRQPNGLAISWQPELISGKIQETTIFLLFSDGAYEKFSNQEITQFFSRSSKIEEVNLRKSIQSLLLNSILRESTDNISVIAVGVRPVWSDLG